MNFMNLNYFIVDCLRYEPHYSHFNLEKVLKLVNFIKPKKLYLQILTLIWITMNSKKNFQEV